MQARTEEITATSGDPNNPFPDYVIHLEWEHSGAGCMAGGVTRTHQVNAARQGTRLPGPNVHTDRLDTGEAYSVRVGTVHQVSGQDDVMAWTGWTDYTTPRYDNLQFWYGGDTPMLNNGRIWVSPTTNLDNVSGTCWLSSAALNCPPGGLYSERVNRGARGTLEPRPP